jgi:catalase
MEPAAPDDSPREADKFPINRRSALLGMAAVAGVAAIDVGAFAYAGGWLRPDALTPAQFADRFEQVGGHHDGFRRNHAKGLAATGTFASSGAAAEICHAAVFATGTLPVAARFSLSGGVPDQPDKLATVRGLAVQFQLPNGEQWRSPMINTPVFVDSTPQGFYERILAAKPQPQTGKPDPAAMSAFLARHPETVAAQRIIAQHPPTAGFADSTFWGLNAFRMTNDQGVTVPVRWMLVPQQPSQPAGNAANSDPNYLFDALIDAMQHGSQAWKLRIVVGTPEDPTHDATQPWPADRRTIDAGTLTIDAVHTEAPGNARDINFDPLVLPRGIAASDDPLLSARSAVYARSFARRAAEPKQPSAVNVATVEHRDDH